MKVYRIQNQKNDGAYSSQAFERDSSRHPLPHRIKDEIVKAGFITSDFYYGFISKKQMKLWFWKTDRIGLDRDGFFLAVYEIPKKYCFYDKYQAAFYLRKAKFIKDIDLARLK